MEHCKRFVNHPIEEEIEAFTVVFRDILWLCMVVVRCTGRSTKYLGLEEAFEYRRDFDVE